MYEVPLLVRLQCEVLVSAPVLPQLPLSMLPQSNPPPPQLQPQQAQPDPPPPPQQDPPHLLH